MPIMAKKQSKPINVDPKPAAPADGRNVIVIKDGKSVEVRT